MSSTASTFGVVNGAVGGGRLQRPGRGSRVVARPARATEGVVPIDPTHDVGGRQRIGGIMRRRMYYVMPDLASARKTMDDLLLARIEERHIHCLAKPGTSMEGLHECNV